MRIHLPEVTYFITKSTSDNMPILTQDRIASIIINAFKYIVAKKSAALHAYVLMPTHYHMILSLNGNDNLSKILHSINSYTAHQISQALHQHRIWNSITWDEVIRNDEMYYQKMAYILLNPWRKGLVENPFELYKYSNIKEICDEYGVDFLKDLFQRYRRFGE